MQYLAERPEDAGRIRRFDIVGLYHILRRETIFFTAFLKKAINYAAAKTPRSRRLGATGAWPGRDMYYSVSFGSLVRSIR